MSERPPLSHSETSSQPVIFFRADLYHHAITQAFTAPSQPLTINPIFHIDEYDAFDPHFDNDFDI